MRACAVDVNLGEHRKRDRIIAGAKLLDLPGVARFLAPELVARKSENRKAAWVEFLMQCFEPPVLRGKAAGAGGVDDQQYLALVPLQRNVLAGKRRCREIVDASHRVSCKSFRSRSSSK